MSPFHGNPLSLFLSAFACSALLAGCASGANSAPLAGGGASAPVNSAPFAQASTGASWSCGPAQISNFDRSGKLEWECTTDVPVLAEGMSYQVPLAQAKSDDDILVAVHVDVAQGKLNVSITDMCPNRPYSSLVASPVGFGYGDQTCGSQGPISFRAEPLNGPATGVSISIAYLILEQNNAQCEPEYIQQYCK